MPPIITILLSYRTISFYVDRYLLEISPILTVLIIAGLFNLPGRWGRWGALLIFLGVTGWGLWQVYFDRTNFSKEDWRTVAQQIDASAQPGDTVVTCTDGHRISFAYYNSATTVSDQDIVNVSDLPEESLTGQSAWVLNMQEGLPVHYLGKSSPTILDSSLLSADAADWEQQNRQDQITVPGITAYQYGTTDQELLSEIAVWHCQN